MFFVATLWETRGKKRQNSLEIKDSSQKKVLSLVLCVAVMLSVMVLGAGAAFSDQDQIENTEAVNMCSALNIIGGYEDGSFHPERNIKRSEITKMICVALNGGKEPNVSTNAVPTFTDVRGTSAAWAEGYIESCVAQGIVSGVGGGRFAPDGNVTGSQLAKMLLVALGYNSDNEGFTGNAWETNVNVRASQKGLYEGLETLDTSAAVTRDQAAQMVWNALNAYEVEYKTNLVTDANGNLVTQITVQDKQTIGANNVPQRVTLLGDKYEAETYVDTFNGNYDTGATGKEGYIDVGGKDFPYNFDLSYIGEEVKVLFKESTEGVDDLDEKDTIYGVYLTGSTSVVNATKNDIDDDYNTAGKVSINDKAYKVADSGKIVTNFVDSATGTSWNTDGVNKIEALSATNGDTVKFVLNDNSEIASVYVTEYKIAKVTAVNSTKVSLSDVGSITIEDNNIYSDIAKDDVVVYTKLYDANNADATFTVTKAEAVSGTLDGYKEGTNKAIEAVTIGGTTYDTMNEVLVDKLTDDAKTTFATGDIGETVTAYLVNGYVACVDMPASSSDYALVTGVGKGTVGGVDEFKMKVLLADGSEKTVTVDEDSTVNTEGSFGVGDLVKYASISDSNVMDVTAVAKDATSDLLTASATADGKNIYDKDTKSFARDADAATYAVSTSDAVLFVKTTENGNYYAYNMRSLGNIKAVEGTTKFYSQLDDDDKVVAAYVELASKPTGATTDTIYGIVTAANGTVKVGDEYKKSFTVANDQESYAVYMSNSSTKLAKGAIVSFDKASDDIYADGDVKVYTAANAKYIKELDSDNVLSYYDAIGGKVITQALDDDAQIVYVDQDNDAAGDNIGVNEYDSIDKYANAVVVLDSNGTKISAIIVESSGECNVVNGMTTREVTLTLGAQTNGTNGAWTAAKTDDAATFAVTATEIADGAISVTWYTDNTYTTTGSVPTNLNVTGDTLSSGKATITMVENSATVAPGTYYFTISIGGMTQQGTLVVDA